MHQYIWENLLNRNIVHVSISMGESIIPKYCTCINIYWDNLLNKIIIQIYQYLWKKTNKQKRVNCCLDIIISIIVNSSFSVSQ